MCPLYTEQIDLMLELKLIEANSNLLTAELTKLLKTKVFNGAFYCLNGSIYHLKNLSASQKHLCGGRRFFRL